MIISFRPKQNSDELCTYLNGDREDVKTEALSLLCALHNVNWKECAEVVGDFLQLAKECCGEEITETDINNYLVKKGEKDK